MYTKLIIFIALFVIFNVHKSCTQIALIDNKQSSALELVIEAPPLFFVSTLDGSLFAVDQQSGDIKWKFKDEPVIKVPLDKEPGSRVFLPDPKDGSLYIMGEQAGNNVLKKLPFTIPQLVQSSPCRSSDGMLYTGRKVDTWIAVDADSGKRHQVLSYDKQELQMCPIDRTRTIFIGRTEYNVMMFDSLRKEKHWNITFYDYKSIYMNTQESVNYDYSHFATNSVGRVLTLNKHSSTIMWQQDFDSPVVAIYIFQGDVLVSIPFTTVALDTLEMLKATSNGGDRKLSPTLYVGQHEHGMYALPSLVDNTVTATTHMEKRLLIEGPKDVKTDKNKTKSDVDLPKKPRESSNPLDFILGHYEMPEKSQVHLHVPGQAAVSGHDNVIETEFTMNASIWNEFQAGNYSVIFTPDAIHSFIKQLISEEYLIIKIMFMFIIIIFSMFYYLHKKVNMMEERNNLIQQVSTGSRSSHSSDITEHSNFEELDGGVIRIGKIELECDRVLGRGCEGTFVFHGRFEGKPVAVKRLLPECFTVADREVDLLRESDEHPNVIRYFCTEMDRQFRYIALELCAATLEDYVLGKYGHGIIKDVDLLAQATSGLAHLHSLFIVHRDIKPHNVLLSYSNNHGHVKAMISDFGLCKKLQRGRHSFSHRSGVTGTDGWIAPEMIQPDVNATCSVDIFSMGCVFYYVLSKGKHPFGDTLRRQANILSGEFNLEDLRGNENAMLYNLISTMISYDPDKRPNATTVLKHPFFWDATRVLTFFQDVSDRVESEEVTNFVMQSLEDAGTIVVRKDWRKHVDEEVASDLRKYRNYRGQSVRDLLRALRNKKHHYRDLTEDARKILGEVPEQFLNYWTSRFPLLLIHSWLAMQCVKQEKSLKEYYDHDFIFIKNYSMSLSASDSLIPDIVEEIPVTPKHLDKKYRNKKHKNNINVDQVWIKNWRDKPELAGAGESVENDDSIKQGPWNRSPNNVARIRQRKPLAQDPIWKINWREPTAQSNEVETKAQVQTEL